VETSLIKAIEERLPSLTRAETAVASVVLRDPDAAVGQTIAVIARDAGVSQPTVLRFCRSVGCSGFRDFKVRLAQSRVQRPWFVHRGILPSDPPSEYARKVIDSALDALVSLRAALDHAAVGRAVDALEHAARHGQIAFFGFGASAAVALDAVCKFLYLVTECHAYADAHLQLMCASTLDRDDVLVAISASGATRELVHAVGLARRAGATVVAITRRGSPLAEASAIVVPADVPETGDVYTPSISRIVHLLLVDTLAAGVALRFRHRTEVRVAAMQRVLRGSRMQGGETLSFEA
jgi:RpiR family transcriptional regulator, carbohydrate utilization regulator